MVKKNIKAKIERLAKALAKDYKIHSIYLFGSRSRNEEHKDSDIDLCIVSPDFKNKTWDLKIAVQRIADKIDPLFDTTITTPKDYRQNWVSPLLDQVRKYGVKVI